jgi:hypothetical protein
VVEVVQRVHGAAIDFYALGRVSDREAGADEVVEGWG